MKIHPPNFTPENWVDFPKSRLYGVPILPTGNITWWPTTSYINFVWELPAILQAHGWWVNAMILRELGALIATKQTDGNITVNETGIVVPKPDGVNILVARAGSRCCSEVTRGYITVTTPNTYEDAENQIAEVVCNRFHEISNFNAIYPRKVHYDNF